MPAFLPFFLVKKLPQLGHFLRFFTAHCNFYLTFNLTSAFQTLIGLKYFPLAQKLQSIMQEMLYN